MSSPSGVTMAALEIVNSAQCVLFTGSTAFGQVGGVKLDAKVATTSVFRIGDSAASVSRKPAENSGSFDLYLQTIPAETATLIGGDTGTGMFLNSALAAQDLTIQVWDGATGVADTQIGVFTITGFVPSGFSLPIDPDSVAKATITFSCDNIIYTTV